MTMIERKMGNAARQKRRRARVALGISVVPVEIDRRTVDFLLSHRALSLEASENPQMIGRALTKVVASLTGKINGTRDLPPES